MFFNILRGSVLERFLDRFLNDFWIDFGEVFGDVFWYNFDTFLYYSAYRAGKDLGRDLENNFFKFGMILDCFLNDLGDHVGMILLFLFILFI